MRAVSSTKKEVPLLIVNRNAGRFRRSTDLADRLSRELSSAAEVIPTRTPEDLEHAAFRAMEAPRPAVVLCGGDGTYLACVTALVRVSDGRPLPPIVLAPGGTVSIVAKNWGTTDDLVRIVRRAALRPETFRVRHRPTLDVEDDRGRRFVGFTFGTGLVARFFAEYERHGAGGNGTALRIVLRTFVASLSGGDYARTILDPLECRLSVDGRALPPTSYSLVVSSVLRDVGLHMLVTHRGGEDARRPHLVASPLSPGRLGPQWPRVALGRPLAGAGNFDGLVESFSVDFAAADGPYVLDGDAFRAKRVTVRGGPTIPIAS